MLQRNPFIEDPPYDSQYPATQATFPINSEGSQLYAILEIAQGRGPHPSIILLHGFPGNEKNFDLAHIFRRAGYNVLIFYYRGSWGSQGDYSFSNCVEDVHAALKFLRSQENAENYRIDVQNIILIGHSWGGFVALKAGIEDQDITKIGSISGFNIGASGKALNRKTSDRVIIELLEDLGPLRGTSSSKLLKEMINHSDEWDLILMANKMKQKDICLIGALEDGVLPVGIHHYPLVQELNKSLNNRLTSIEFKTSHSYSDCRIQLAKFLLEWLLKR